VAATRQFGGHGLAETELPAYPADLRLLCGTRLQHKFVACSGVSFRASRVEFNFPTGGTTPSRKALISLVLGYAQSTGKPPRIFLILNGKAT